jgi:Leucine-rich repeat (LRR) protein
VSNNPILTLDGIENLNQLSSLFIASTRIVSLKNLESLINLEQLDLSSFETTIKLVSLRGVEKLTKLTEFRGKYNNFKKVEELENTFTRVKHQSNRVSQRSRKYAKIGMTLFGYE